MNKLSYTSVSVFKECQYKFKLQYIDRVRTKTTSSALIFGSAIDKAIEKTLKTFPNCSLLETYRHFDDEFEEIFINEEKVDIENSDLIKWSKADFDEDLGKSVYLSMMAKGFLIIQSFFNNVIPKIEKVISIQEPIELINSNGDSIIGFCDAVIKFKDFDKLIILDFKTSRKSYKPEALQLSEQLALYKHSLSEKYNTDLVGFAVFSKDIKKTFTNECQKCKAKIDNPRVKKCAIQIEGKRCNGEFKVIDKKFESPFQLMIDTVDEKFVDGVLNDFDRINAELQIGDFKKNYKSCFGKFGPCLYKELCHKGNMDNYLIKEKK